MTTRATAVGVLILLLVALIGAPWLIGRDVQRRFAEFTMLPGYDTVVDRYEAGWFTSTVHWHPQPHLQIASAPLSARWASAHWGVVTDISHGPLLFAVHAEDWQAPRIGYAALHTVADETATPAWRRWLGANTSAAHLDVVYGLNSGFSAHGTLPAFRGVLPRGGYVAIRGVDVSAVGSGDDGLQLAMRIAHGERVVGKVAEPTLIDALVLSGDVTRAGNSPWVWVGDVRVVAKRLAFSVAGKPLSFGGLQLNLSSRLEDAGLMAAIIETRATSIAAGTQTLAASQGTLVAKSLSASGIARSLALFAQLRALDAEQQALADRLFTEWRTDVLPAALKLSPELVLTRGESHIADSPLTLTGRVQVDGHGLVLPEDLGDRSFWAQHITADMAARFGNVAAQRVANVWWGDAAGAARKSIANVSLSEMMRQGKLVPTQHGFVANFAMQQGRAAWNGLAFALAGGDTGLAIGATGASR